MLISKFIFKIIKVDVQVLNTSKMDEFNNQLLALQGTYPLGCNGSCLGPNITDKKVNICVTYYWNYHSFSASNNCHKIIRNWNL